MKESGKNNPINRRFNKSIKRLMSKVSLLNCRGVNNSKEKEEGAPGIMISQKMRNISENSEAKAASTLKSIKKSYIKMTSSSISGNISLEIVILNTKTYHNKNTRSRGNRS